MLSVPDVIEICGDIGFDWVYMDFEHNGPSAWDNPVLSNYARAAEVSEVGLCLKMPSGDPPLVRKALDAGIRTLLIPQIEDAAPVKEAVEAARFTFDGASGKRGATPSRVNGFSYSADYTTVEDESVAIGAMIENTEAVDNLDEILQVPHLDFVRIGRNDLRVSKGLKPGQDDSNIDPEMERIERKCREYDVPLSFSFSDTEEVRSAVDRGYRLPTIASDIGSIVDTFETNLRTMRSGLE
jgi:2-dehydro-3-deoxyglucarate aldolase